MHPFAELPPAAAASSSAPAPCGFVRPSTDGGTASGVLFLLIFSPGCSRTSWGRRWGGQDLPSAGEGDQGEGQGDQTEAAGERDSKAAATYTTATPAQVVGKYFLAVLHFPSPEKRK